MIETSSYPTPPTVADTVERAIADAGAIRLPVIERGDRGGVPVVLLHGLSDSNRSYERMMEHLPPSLRVLAITTRGHGDAPKPEYGYSPRQLAADVRRTLDEAGVVRAVIVGHSMGSVVASRFALEYPQRTAALVLMGGFAHFDGPELAGFSEMVMSLEDPIDPGFVREFQESTLAQPIPDGMLDEVVSESLKLPARVWHASVSEVLNGHDARALRRIAVPTMLAWGDQDANAPREHQDILQAAIPHARLKVYRGAGHAFHWEDPVPFTRDLVAFVREHIRS